MIVPPGWMSWLGAVLGELVTLPIPPTTGRADGDAAGLVVAVVFLAVVAVDDFTVVDEPPAVAVVLVVASGATVSPSPYSP